MSKYSKAQLDKVITLMLSGVGAAAARKQAGVSHTPAELHVFKFEWLIAGLPQPGVGQWAPTADLVAYLRSEGWGWGKIMVATDSTEGKVRRLFEEATNTESRALRVGKGGRFFRDEPKLYEDTLKASGTSVPKGQLGQATSHAEMQKLMKRDFNDLRAEAVEAGLIEPKARTTKAKLVKLLLGA